ncbi:unnamed protein product [Linum tenue]|uniref:KANL3/Tex30 alpha/beta hydrolase-like domain-containing protein n=1 Tax=Linum tenue TaxID=586396 RepID=A0AAV0JFH2_9ROSI|nr:unnamed protein product [Linum tenue]
MATSPPPKRRRKNAGAKVTPSLPLLPPVVVFAHGAGAPSWKELLKNAVGAVEVVTFDYPYLCGGKKRAPPKAEKLVEFHKGIVKETSEKYPRQVSCMVSAEEDIAASAILCLGYPLKGSKGAIRDETLVQLKVPIMFVQGSKDGMCPLEKLQAVRKKIKCETELYVVDGGDHSLKVGKKHLQANGLTQEESEMNALEAVGSFISSCLKP